MNADAGLTAENCLSVAHLTHYLDEPVETTRFYTVWVEKTGEGRGSSKSRNVRITDDGVLVTLEGGKAISRARYSVHEVETL